MATNREQMRQMKADMDWALRHLHRPGKPLSARAGQLLEKARSNFPAFLTLRETFATLLNGQNADHLLARFEVQVLPERFPCSARGGEGVPLVQSRLPGSRGEFSGN